MKNDASGPGNWRLNTSLFKDFKTFREQYLEFRADAFNILNHPSFGNPGNTSSNIGANSVSLTGPFTDQANTIDCTLLPVVREVRILTNSRNLLNAIIEAAHIRAASRALSR